jgi:hypothetical protein
LKATPGADFVAIAFGFRLLRAQAENQEATWVRIFGHQWLKSLFGKVFGLF